MLIAARERTFTSNRAAGQSGWQPNPRRVWVIRKYRRTDPPVGVSGIGIPCSVLTGRRNEVRGASSYDVAHCTTREGQYVGGGLPAWLVQAALRPDHGQDSGQQSLERVVLGPLPGCTHRHSGHAPAG